MPRLLAGGCLVLVTACVHAGEFLSFNAITEHGIYSLEFEALIDANRKAVFRVVTDYDQLHRLSDTILASQRLATYPNGRVRQQLQTRVCVLVLCFDATRVEDIETTGHTLITTHVVASLSDFKFGQSYWHLVPESGRTRLFYKAVIEPDFWVPPVLGPFLIKRQMRKVSEEIIQNIERLANDA